VVAAPDARVWSRTAQFNMPFNVSLVGAITYLVRTTCQNQATESRANAGCVGLKSSLPSAPSVELKVQG